MSSKTVLFLATLLIAVAQNAPAQSQVRGDTIVFVCEHGSAKSVVAAAHFNRLAAENRLPYRAVARGLNPDQSLPPAIKAGLLADGLDPSAFTPQAITKPEIQGAARVVAMGTDLPETSAKAKVVRWNGIPSLSENYPAARAAIVEQVKELLATLPPAGKK